LSAGEDFWHGARKWFAELEIRRVRLPDDVLRRLRREQQHDYPYAPLHRGAGKPASAVRPYGPLLVANHPYRVRIVPEGGRNQYWSDGQLNFGHRDPAPYTDGWFALRTVAGHLTIRDFRN
jgi:Domain of unknown function (DUF6250)